MSSQSKPELLVAWCSYAAAKYAVEHWHYSRIMPRSKNVYLGVWESNQFRGVIIFGLGAGASTNGRKYGLAKSFDVAELERVALLSHNAPVSRIVAIAISMLKHHSPNLRLLVSYADPAQGHNGSIYQAGNWVYVGSTPPDWRLVDAKGRMWHPRVVWKTKRKKHFGHPGRGIHISQGVRVETPGKYKYLYPLDAEIRQRILPLAQPYPKRQKDSSEPLGPPAEKGRGSTDPDAPQPQQAVLA